jgi:hypothetical protein
MILFKTERLGERLSNISPKFRSYTKFNGFSNAHEYVGIRFGQDLHGDLLALAL